MRTFLNNLSRFRAATLLNLLGLTVAYVVALVIVLQVYAEYTVDTRYPDGDRLYRLEYRAIGGRDMSWQTVLNRPLIEVARTASPGIEQIAYSGGWLGDRLKVQGNPIEDVGFESYVSGIGGGFVDLFGMQMVEGTTLDSNKRNVIIPLSMARERFVGGSAVGQKFDLLNGSDGIKELTVVGVYRDFESWSTHGNRVYYNNSQDGLTDWGNYSYRCFVRIRPGADMTRVMADLNRTLNEALQAVERSAAVFRLQSLPDAYFATDYGGNPRSNRTKINLFALVALLVIAIGAINYINFATALVPMRIRGINTRKVYGASNGRLRRGLLAEALVLSLGAYTLAALGVCALDSLDGVSFVPSKVVPIAYLELIGCGALVAVGVGLLAGLFPALYSTSIPAAIALKGSFGLSPRGKVLRTVLVGFQFVVSMVLIVAAVVMNIQYRYAQNRDLGFQRQYVLTVSATPAMDKARTALTAQLSQLSEVSQITHSTYLMAGVSTTYGREFRGQDIEFGVMTVASNFVPFYGLKIVEGSDFTQADDVRNSSATVIFNRTAQKAYNIAVGDSIDGAKVVGIVSDFHAASLHEPIGPLALYNYGNDTQHWRFFLHLKVTTDDWQRLTARINQICRTIDPNYMGTVKLLDSYIEELYADDERATTMVTWFGGAAILVSLFGVFGLVYFEVSARRKEIGLRKINGATVGSVVSIFVWRFVWLVVGACVVAIPLAWWVVQKLLEPFAYRAPIGWGVYAAAALAVLAVVVTTVVLQTLGAARENPVDSIKTE